MKILKNYFVLILGISVFIHLFVNPYNILVTNAFTTGTSGEDIQTSSDGVKCKLSINENFNAIVDKKFPDKICASCQWRYIKKVTEMPDGQFYVEYGSKSSDIKVTEQTCKMPAEEDDSKRCNTVFIAGKECPSDEVYNPSTYTGPISSSTGTN